MQHTYLRYECADAFSLTTSSSTTSLLTSSPLAFLKTSSTDQNSSILLSTAGSQIIGFNLRTNEPCLKISYKQLLSGGLGSGRALNSNEVLCIVSSSSSSSSSSSLPQQNNSTNCKIATGWKDGSIRIFDIYQSDFDTNISQMNHQKLGLVHSLLSSVGDYYNSSSSKLEEFAMREPLVLNGHSNSPITCLVFDNGDYSNTSTFGSTIQTTVTSRLASGSSDGTIILWDILAETGLFRLLGHSGPITDLSFVSLPQTVGGGSSSGGASSRTSQSFNSLISSSLDGLVKVWDLEGQYCSQTIANHGGPVSCSVALAAGYRKNRNINSSSDGEGDDQETLLRWRLVTGCHDGKVRVWSVDESKRSFMQSKDLTMDTNNDNDTGTGPLKSEIDDVCTYMGQLSPPPNVAISNDKVTSIHFHESGKYCGIARSNSKNIDIYLIRNESEAEKKRKRRLRRKREKEGKQTSASSEETTKKGKKRGILDSDDEEQEADDKDKSTLEEYTSDDIKASDEFEYISTIHASHKIKAFSFAPFQEKNGGIRVVCALATNALEVHSVTKAKVSNSKSRDDETKSLNYVSSLVSSLDMYGHPTGVRSISLSSDDILACTVSKNALKVWNVENRSCLRSLTLNTSESKSAVSAYGLCVLFLHGDNHAVVGTREGFLLIIDIASGSVVYSEKAHEGAVWSIDMKRPNLQYEENSITIVTGSADCHVKFWEIERQDDDSLYPGHPTLVHVRTLQTTDDIVAVKYSNAQDPSKRMVFVSTLDCQIKVFFDDSLKLFLSLYGHSLPALALDASSDDTILASGGADKSIKIWGLDFGDTHRTLYGHSDSITDLKFVKRTHNFFTCSKDSTIRYWDGDRFQQILLLQGHNSEVNCLSIAKSGGYLLTGGMDRQVRVWERTKDMVFLEEEKERELEEMFEKMDSRKDDTETGQVMRQHQEEEGDVDDVAQGDLKPQSEAAVKRSVLSISSGDRLMEAIEYADQEVKDSAAFYASQKGKSDLKRIQNPMLLGMEPPSYILWILRTIKSAELEQSLLILPLSHLERLIYYLIILLRNGQGTEISSRVAVFLIKTHQSQIISNKLLAVPLRELKRLVKIRLSEVRNTIGYNLAAIRIINKAAQEHKSRYYIPENNDQNTDMWKGLGLGGDATEILYGNKRTQKKRK